MFTMLMRLQSAARKRRAYRETRAALAGLPVDVALDLDIYPGDADRIARKVVYGA